MAFNAVRVKLKTVCEIKYGKDHKKLADGNVPAYGSGGLMRYVERSIHDKKSVLIPRKGTLSNLFLVDPPFWTVDTLFWTDIDTEKIHPDFLYYQLCTMDLASRNVGTAVPSLTTALLNDLEIQLPSMETQEQIVTILASLDAKIESNNRINDNLQQLAQALFESWFVDFIPFGGKKPADWNEGVFSDIVDFSNGYAFKSRDLLDGPELDTYKVFKQGHIKRGGGFNPDGTKSWYPRNKAVELKKYVLQKGDILMAMTDMKDNVQILGNTAIMEVDDEYIVNQRVGVLRCKEETGVSYPLVFLLTNSKDFLSDLRSRANRGVQVNLSSAEIKNSKVLIAPKKVYEDFDSIVKPLFELMISNDIENQRLADLRDALLQKLMSGEIDVSDIQL